MFILGRSSCVSTDRLVFDGGAGHTQVKLAIFFDAGINQSLHRALVLKQQEGIPCTSTTQAQHTALTGDSLKVTQTIIASLSAPDILCTQWGTFKHTKEETCL